MYCRYLLFFVADFWDFQSVNTAKRKRLRRVRIKNTELYSTVYDTAEILGYKNQKNELIPSDNDSGNTQSNSDDETDVHIVVIWPDSSLSPTLFPYLSLQMWV